MARHKNIYRASWSGETIIGPTDTSLVLHPEHDPERTIIVTIAPTQGRRLHRELEAMFQRAQFSIVNGEP